MPTCWRRRRSQGFTDEQYEQQVACVLSIVMPGPLLQLQAVSACQPSLAMNA